MFQLLSNYSPDGDISVQGSVTQSRTNSQNLWSWNKMCILLATLWRSHYFLIVLLSELSQFKNNLHRAKQIQIHFILKKCQMFACIKTKILKLASSHTDLNGLSVIWWVVLSVTACAVRSARTESCPSWSCFLSVAWDGHLRLWALLQLRSARFSSNVYW